MRSARQTSIQLGPSAVLAALLVSAMGCDGWPRYANKPSTDENALPPDAPPSSGIQVTWSAPTLEEENGSEPGEAVELALLEGIVHTGELSGMGWDVDASVKRVSACDNALAFPPDAPGTYTGDVDWVTVEIVETGVLCLSLLTDAEGSDEIGGSARIDAVLYSLDDCNEPTALFVEDGTSSPIGADLPVGTVEWAIGVEAGTVAAVGIAGFWPDDETLTLPWDAHLSLVPGIAAAPSALCPEVAE